jgi:hypothetical protein
MNDFAMMLPRFLHNMQLPNNTIEINGIMFDFVYEGVWQKAQSKRS